MKKSFLLIATTLFSITVFAQTPNKGLIGDYYFNNNANNYIGNNIDGTVHGCTLTADRFGNPNAAYLLSSAADYIEFPYPNFVLNEYSYVLWVSPSSLPSNGNWQCVLEVGGYGGDQQIALENNVHTPLDTMILNGFSVGPYNQGIPKQNFISAQSTPSVGKWYFLTFTRDSSTVKFYVNGILINNVPVNSLAYYGLNSQKAYIGQRYNGTVPFLGKVDDAKMYNRAITQEEVTALFYENVCTQNVTVTDTLVINVNVIFNGTNPPITFSGTIKAYPNPAKDHLIIDCGDDFNSLSSYTIKVMNSQGQSLYAQQIMQQLSNIDLSGWASGIYFIHVIDAKNNTLDVRKIVLK